MDEFWPKVRELLTKSFNETEFKDLMFDEGIDESELTQSNTRDLAREILQYVKRKYNQEKQIRFYEALKEARPNFDWPDWPAEEQPTNTKTPISKISLPKKPSKIKKKKESTQLFAWATGLAGLAAIVVAIVFTNGYLESGVETNDVTQMTVAEEQIHPPTVAPTATNDLPSTAPIAPQLPTEIFEATIAPVGTTSTQPLTLLKSDNELYQVSTKGRVGLFNEPKEDSDIIMFTSPDDTLTVFRKDTPNNYKWLYVETETQNAGWIKINNNIEKLSAFNYDDLPSRYDVSEPSPSSNDSVSVAFINKSETTSKLSSSCALQVEFKYTLDSDHEIRWSNLPDEANKATLSVNRISADDGDLIPLVKQNTLDSGAIQQGVFHIPRTRFDERGYKKDDIFQITLVILDSNESKICSEPVKSVFTWDGRK